MSDAVDHLDAASYAYGTVDAQTMLPEIGFVKVGSNTSRPNDPAEVWHKKLGNHAVAIVVTHASDPQHISLFLNQLTKDYDGSMPVNNRYVWKEQERAEKVPVGDLRRRLVQLESLDDEVDVESYVKNSTEPDIALKELGFEFKGNSTLNKAHWLRRMGRGWWESVIVNNETGELDYRRLKFTGRGSLDREFTVHDHASHTTMNTIRRKVLKWKHDDAEAVVEYLIGEADAFDPRADIDQLMAGKCPHCGSSNITVGDAITDCNNCGNWFGDDISLPVAENVEDDPEEFLKSMPPANVPRITTSFSQTTPESSEQGDVSDSGWIDEEGDEIVPDAYDFEEGLGTVDLAVKWLLDKGACQASSSDFYPGVWYSTGYSTTDYRTGTDEERNFHLKDFSPEEERRIWNTLHQKWRSGGRLAN